MAEQSNFMVSGETRRQRAVILLARSAFAAAPHNEMKRLAELVSGADSKAHVVYAFSEQGTPSLREALDDLLRQEMNEICILPLMLPLETSFPIWIKRSLSRWQLEDGKSWPPVRIAPAIGESPVLTELLVSMVAADAPDIAPAEPRAAPEGSLVPHQKHRVLVCQGGPCNSAGADVIWGHLRNHQHRRKLKESGDGMMSAKTTCLGPCNLAPVLQVYPDGTYYGGVDETAVDRIIDEHILEGRVVEDFAYHPTGRKQRLRTAG